MSKTEGTEGKPGNGSAKATAGAGEPEEVLAGVVAAQSEDELVASETPPGGKRLSHEDLRRVTSRAGLIELLRARKIDLKKVIGVLRYEEELALLQVELVKLQRWAEREKRRVAILFEGRDAAGKGGTIRRFTEHLNPRALRVVALPKPTQEEQGQWYFQRYARQLPNPGEIVFFESQLVQPRGCRAGERLLQPRSVRDLRPPGARVRAHALRRRAAYHQVLVLHLEA